MRKPPHIERRGNRWWYRRRVPANLVPFIGREEYRESLHTADMELAVVRAAVRNVEVTVALQAA